MGLGHNYVKSQLLPFARLLANHAPRVPSSPAWLRLCKPAGSSNPWNCNPTLPSARPRFLGACQGLAGRTELANLSPTGQSCYKQSHATHELRRKPLQPNLRCSLHVSISVGVCSICLTMKLKWMSARQGPDGCEH